MRHLVLLSTAAALVAAMMFARGQAPKLTQIRAEFANPPDNARIMMRWWWFGPAVTESELARELHVMKQAGIGGVEIQPVYPLASDDPQTEFKNLAYLSDAFLSRIRFASEEANRLGLRVDITLGSGWPYGGPQTPVTRAAGHLRVERIDVPDGTTSLPLPTLENGEQLLAAWLAEGDHQHYRLGSANRLTDLAGDRVKLPKQGRGPHMALFFISGRTGMQVKRAGVGAEGFVLDHYDLAAIRNHLNEVGGPLLRAFGPHPPYAIFSDSLEVFESDWTSNLLEEFKRRRGYALEPYLPALIGDIGDITAYVRHDWGQTLTELAEENYLKPIRAWAHQHETRFRSQTYGIPPVLLSSNDFVDLPEGEAGPQWRRFNTARWASSASHLYGRPVTSSETWTWLHSPAFRATPLDMKAEADLHFIEGINQLIGHGWPYSPPSASQPGWRFYAAGAFNDHNPWFFAMPDLTKYLQRISFLMRQGTPANDVAIYLPTDDAWARFTAGHDSVDRSMDELIGPDLIPAILNAGYNFDFVDDRAITSRPLPYRILILPGVERMPPKTLQTLLEWVKQGGSIVATRRLPSLVPGLLESKQDAGRTRSLAAALFSGNAERAVFIENEAAIANVLRKFIAPDFAVSSNQEAIGFVHRKLPATEIYFIANTSNEVVSTEAHARVTGRKPEQWDPFTGERHPVSCKTEAEYTSLPFSLQPYESRILVFSNDALAPSTAADATETMDLSSNWQVSFSNSSRREQMAALRSWTDMAEHQFYSGQATYEKTIRVAEHFLTSHAHVLLDFGGGTPVPIVPRRGPGMRAWIESPVREAAEVYVNGQNLGVVWHPPYQLNVKPALHVGENNLRIVVGNSAINVLAGQMAPDYRLLNARYGNRFTPQDMENLRPLPSGILGPVRLLGR
jgi:hypothetical protein